MNHKLIAFALPVVAAFAVSCGSNTPSLTPIRVSAMETPPAALAAITPAAGLPTVPPAGSTLPPVTALPSTTSLPASTATPVPAPSGSDLAALVAGQPPSANYFAALAQAAASDYTSLPPNAPRAIGGTITGFTANGIVIEVSPPIESGYAEAHGLAYASGVNAAGAQNATVLVSAQTFDYVPGGYGALRTGGMLLALGTGTAGAFQAGIVFGGIAVTPVNSAVPDPSTPEPDVANTKSPAYHVDASSPKQRVPFVLGTTYGFPSKTFPNPVLSHYYGAPHACIVASFTPSVSYGLGSSANFPMEIDDISTPASFVEATAEPLPIRLINTVPIPQPSVAQYSINYGVSLTLDLRITLSGCGNTIIRDGTYLFNLVTLGQEQSEFGYGSAPAQGSTLAIVHKNCPYVSFPVNGALSQVLNVIYSPSLEFCQDDTLMGASIKGQAQIDNAKLISTPGVMTNSTWDYLSALPGGDPQVTLMPMAASDASVQPNHFQLESVEYDATDYSSIVMSLSLFGAKLPVGNFPHVPSVSVFQYLDGPFRTGVSTPQDVLVTLTPSEGTANVNGK